MTDRWYTFVYFVTDEHGRPRRFADRVLASSWEEADEKAAAFGGRVDGILVATCDQDTGEWVHYDE